MFFNRKPQFTDRAWLEEKLKFSDALHGIQSSLQSEIMPLCVYHFKNTGIKFERYLIDHGLHLKRLNALDELDSRTGESWRKSTDAILIASSMISVDHLGSKRSNIRKKQFSLHLIEHYPIPDPDERILQFCAKRRDILDPIAYVALNEPWLVKSIGDRVIPLLEKLGLDENECLEHALISSSIRRAQQKLKESISVERPHDSMQAWVDDNLES